MALTTYTELKASIADWLNRGDLTTVIPDFITLLEARLKRHHAVERSREATITLDAQHVSLPTDCREVGELYFNDDTRQGPIDLMSPSALAKARGINGWVTSSYPRAAAFTRDGSGRQQLLLAPTPDTSYTAGIEYVQTLTPLSGSNEDNWVLLEHPDVYLFGSLVHSAPYLKDDSRLATWKTTLDEALAELDALVDRETYGANTLVQRPQRAIG
jgi:hypothetical protein